MRRQREVIGPKYQIRFRDLSGWHRIEVKCFSCDHAREFYLEGLKELRVGQLQRRQGQWDQRRLREEIQLERVADLEDLLRCSVCGNYTNNTLRIVKLPRD